MWYAVYRNDTGALVSIGTVLGEGIPGAELGAVPYEQRPDLALVEWDPAQRLFVPKPPAPPQRTISKRSFMGRIPVAHLVALNALRIDPAAPIQLRATLNTAAELRDLVSEINLDDPATQQFVPVATDALISLGMVPAQDRATYIASWLRDPE